MAGNRGRPSKFTPERRKQILSLIRAGNYLDTACQAAGITYSAFREWIKRGEAEHNRLERYPRSKPKDSERDYFDFFEDMKKAEAMAEARNLTIINKAAEKNWQAAAWYLERKAPERWGRKDRVQADITHSGQIDSTQTVQSYGKLTEEELRKLAKLSE